MILTILLGIIALAETVGAICSVLNLISSVKQEKDYAHWVDLQDRAFNTLQQEKQTKNKKRSENKEANGDWVVRTKEPL